MSELQKLLSFNLLNRLPIPSDGPSAVPRSLRQRLSTELPELYEALSTNKVSQEQHVLRQ